MWWCGRFQIWFSQQEKGNVTYQINELKVLKVCTSISLTKLYLVTFTAGGTRMPMLFEIIFSRPEKFHSTIYAVSVFPLYECILEYQFWNMLNRCTRMHQWFSFDWIAICWWLGKLLFCIEVDNASTGNFLVLIPLPVMKLRHVLNFLVWWYLPLCTP